MLWEEQGPDPKLSDKNWNEHHDSTWNRNRNRDKKKELAMPLDQDQELEQQLDLRLSMSSLKLGGRVTMSSSKPGGGVMTSSSDAMVQNTSPLDSRAVKTCSL